MFDDVFLIAPLVGAENYFGWSQIGERCDVEKVANIVKESFFAFCFADVFAQYNDSVRPGAFARPVFEFGNIFILQVEIEEFPFLYDPVFLVWLVSFPDLTIDPPAVPLPPFSAEKNCPCRKRSPPFQPIHPIPQ